MFHVSFIPFSVTVTSLSVEKPGFPDYAGNPGHIYLFIPQPGYQNNKIPYRYPVVPLHIFQEDLCSLGNAPADYIPFCLYRFPFTYSPLPPGSPVPYPGNEKKPDAPFPVPGKADGQNDPLPHPQESGSPFLQQEYRFSWNK